MWVAYYLLFFVIANNFTFPTASTEDVTDHIERLEKMRKCADLHGDKRTFLGAVAGVVVTDEVRDYALNQGFYLIEPSGESFDITPPNGNPKEWEYWLDTRTRFLLLTIDFCDKITISVY